MPAVASRGRGRRTINEINMVPFIDVMLVLLIIFMVTAPLITPSSIDLPSIGKAAKQPDQIIQVLIDKDERIRIKTTGEPTSSNLKDFAQTVKQIQGKPATANVSAVVISADKSIKYETVVKAMDNLQRAGVARVGLSVQTN